MNSRIVSVPSSRSVVRPAQRATPARFIGARALELAESDWETAVLEESKKRPVLVDVWATWCGPCKLVAAALPTVEQKYGDKLQVVKVNADECPKVVEQYKVYGLPTLLIFKDGQLVEGSKKEGAIPAPAIVKHLEKFGVTPTN